jgi:hypothetical protein
MIHHISIPSRDPVHVAAVLAELMNGRDFPFSGPLPGARMAMSGDPHGTMIEVYPDTITLVPGADETQVAFVPGTPASYAAFHALMSVPLDRATIERIGKREGWRTRFFGRGSPGKPPAFHLGREQNHARTPPRRPARGIYRPHADPMHGRNHARPRSRCGRMIVYPLPHHISLGEEPCPQNASETY